MRTLTRTRTRMVRINDSRMYTSWEEDGDRTTIITIDEHVLEDFDYPDVITVTIEPGDILNSTEETAQRNIINIQNFPPRDDR